MSTTLFGALRRLDESRFRAELYRAWSAGKGAGFDHGPALEQLGPVHSPSTEELRRYLIVGARQEKSVAAMVKARPELFEPLEAAVLGTGDDGGQLDLSLRLLADLYSHEYKRMVKVRLLMGYPIFVGVIASFLVAVLFLQRGGWTGYMVAFAVFLAAFVLGGGIIISMFASLISAGATYAIPRFVRALASCVEVGIPQGRAVRLAVDASKNADLKAQIAKRSDRELNAVPLGTLFDGCRIVTPALLGQMRVADATGDFRDTLRRYVDDLEPTER
jgi:type II secretory pathway component PulF